MDNSILFLLYFLAAGLGILAICCIGVLISIWIEKRRNNNLYSEPLIYSRV